MELEGARVVPVGWSIKALDDVCTRITSGGTPSRRNPSFFENGTWPWVKTQELIDSWIDDTEEHITDAAIEASSAKVLPANSVLMAMYGATVGQLGILRRPMTCNQACCVLITDENEAHFRYLYYLLLSQRPQIKRLSTGAAQQNLSGLQIKRFRLPFPLVEEQRAIAHILGTLDDKIELNRRMNETLEAIARAIFKSWFVDFDPVRAKASGEPPESICRRLGLTPDLLALFPDRLVDSELGEIPEGWEARRLDAIASLVTTSISPASQPDTVFEHYSIPAFDAAAMPSYELGSTIKSNKYAVSPLAVLVSKLNPETPRVWLPAVKTDTAICSTEFMQFVPHFANRRSYLYLMMRSDRMQAEILKRVTGSTGSRQRAQPSQVVTLPVVVPPERVADSFDAVSMPMLALIAQSREQSRTLGVVRDTLLPKLLSGDLRVPLEGAA